MTHIRQLLGGIEMRSQKIVNNVDNKAQALVF